MESDGEYIINEIIVRTRVKRRIFIKQKNVH